MKAIIVAAGMSSRLIPNTNDKPKCLIEVNDATILHRQLDVLRTCGVEDIVVVRGYKGGMIDYSGITYYEDTSVKYDNIPRSLFCAEEEMGEEFIFSYSDIIYEQDTLERLIASKSDITLVVDVDWLAHYEGRLLHPISEAELVALKDGRVSVIDKGLSLPVYGEFIGLAKFSMGGARALKCCYHSLPEPEAYLTGVLQRLVDTGCIIEIVDIRGGWTEIDTPEDLVRAEKWLS